MNCFRTEIIGDATLILGDCREILPTLGKVDAVVTDPPYLMGSASTRQGKGIRSRIGDWTNASVFVEAWLSQCWNALNRDGVLWVCGNWRSMPALTMAADAVGANISSVVVWDKDWIGVGPLNGLRQRYELVFQIGKGGFGITNRSEPDIWRVPWASQRVWGHDAEKPVELMQRAIENGAGSVLDPFMGSGTTGVAAIKLSRKFIGIEIEPKYFDIACRRIEEAWKQPRLFEEPKPKAEQLSLMISDQTETSDRSRSSPNLRSPT